MEKYTHVSGTMHFKRMLFKSQLYTLKQGRQVTKKGPNTLGERPPVVKSQ